MKQKLVEKDEELRNKTQELKSIPGLRKEIEDLQMFVHKLFVFQN